MNWVFNRDNQLRASLRKYSFTLSSKSPPPEGACLEVFRTHWQQAYSVIEKDINQHTFPTHDDIASVINNLDQLITLLLQEADESTACISNSNSAKDPESAGPLLSFLLLEGCLDKLLSWSLRTGEFVNVLKIEQLKFYEILVTNCHQDLLFHKPIVRPLLRLLASCTECAPVEVEKRLIILLNTLCVCLTQYPDLLQVFFKASSDHGPTRSEKRDMFLIFSLLIPFVHREGAIGQQARDALLLCMALSRRNENIGIYIAEHSNFCPVLATGLSGLYSVLPRKLPNVTEDWHRFNAEDISEMPELSMFLNSLEFCNAVIQVAHPLVQEQLMEYLYQGFLVPVLGPALHQNTVEEIIATTAYLELFLRTITEPILLQMFLKFILTSSYDGHHILNSLIDRLGAQSKLCMVTLALFQCLLDTNCEDVLFELVFRYLIPCTHVMVSQRSRVRDVDLYNHAAEKFLSLIPSVSSFQGCLSTSQSISSLVAPSSSGFNSIQSFPAVSRGGSLRIKRHQHLPSRSSFSFGEIERLQSFLPEWYGNFPNIKISSYMDYLQEANKNVKTCSLACRCWSAAYNGIEPLPSAVNDSILKQKENVNCSKICLNDKSLNCNEEFKLSCSYQLNIDNNNLINNVPKLSTEDSVVLENSFNETSINNNVENLVVENDAMKNIAVHNSFITRDVLHQIVNADDEKIFWNLVCSTETPIDINDDDSLQTIDGYFNEIEIDFKQDSKFTDTLTENHESKDECSNIDSGIFNSSDSCVLEKDMTVQSAKFSIDTDYPSVTLFSTKDCLVKCSSICTPETSTKTGKNVSSSGSWEPFSTPNIGPFLSIILTRLEMMMQNDVYTNLHLTGLISRLACYPQPLLRSFLLNPMLVFQPTVRSLFQVLGSLKHKIDSYSCTVDNYEELVKQSKQFLFSRIQNLSQLSTNRTYSSSLSRIQPTSDIQRGEPRRRSLTSFLFRKSSFLRNKESNLNKGPMLEPISDNQGYRYVNRPTLYSLEGEMEAIKARNAVLCAIVLEDFLKELAAIAQEHSVIQLNPGFWDELCVFGND